VIIQSNLRLRHAGILALLCFASPLSAAPLISEFMAVNDTSYQDEDGDFSDWIEIHNPGPAPVQLDGYHLTDNAANLTKWTFPAITLNADQYLVIFASNKDRTDPASQLHTGFRLSSGGEFLGLVAPDGTTIVSAFGPVYPPQFDDQSFGFGVPGSSSNLDLTPFWSSPGTTRMSR